MLIRLFDFEHYFQAARMIWHSQSPYGSIEFFAPPWLALLIAPLIVLPVNIASVLWLLMSISSIYGTVLLSLRWLVSFPVRHWQLIVLFFIAALTPAALFTYITGQISPLVGFAALIVSREISNKRFNTPLIVIGVLISTLKPHIVLFPLFLCGLELIRLRKYRVVMWCLAGLAAVVLFAFLTNRNWPAELLLAWQRGDYRGGKPGLVSPGYLGLTEVGIPVWIFWIFAVYILNLWRTQGLTAQVVALSFSAALLMIPYSRSYDYVVYLFPFVSCLAGTPRNRWLACSAALVGLFVLPLTRLSLLTPVVMLLSGMLCWDYLSPRRQPRLAPESRFLPGS